MFARKIMVLMVGLSICGGLYSMGGGTSSIDSDKNVKLTEKCECCKKCFLNTSVKIALPCCEKCICATCYGGIGKNVEWGFLGQPHSAAFLFLKHFTCPNDECKKQLFRGDVDFPPIETENQLVQRKYGASGKCVICRARLIAFDSTSNFWKRYESRVKTPCCNSNICEACSSHFFVTQCKHCNKRLRWSNGKITIEHSRPAPEKRNDDSSAGNQQSFLSRNKVLIGGGLVIAGAALYYWWHKKSDKSSDEKENTQGDTIKSINRTKRSHSKARQA